jgi:hypothetical protein
MCDTQLRLKWHGDDLGGKPIWVRVSIKTPKRKRSKNVPLPKNDILKDTEELLKQLQDVLKL